jgi:hypothetical protein
VLLGAVTAVPGGLWAPDASIGRFTIGVPLSAM